MSWVVSVDKYRWNNIGTIPMLRRSESLPGDAMLSNAAPLRSKCVLPDPQIPPGHKSVITTVTGVPEQTPFSVHFTCLEGTERMRILYNAANFISKNWNNNTTVQFKFILYLIASSTAFSFFEQNWTSCSYFWLERELFHCAAEPASTPCLKQVQYSQSNVGFRNSHG